MKNRITLAMVAAGGLILGTAGDAGAQVTWDPGYHSSTIAEGYQRGFADVVRSYGTANLLNSEAAINWEKARSLDYNNRLQGTETYFTQRRMNQQYRDQERGAPPTSEQVFRWAHRNAPKALSSYEFDPLNGQINWPIALRATAYDNYRKVVEDYFRMRAENPEKLTLSDYTKLQEVTDMWLMAFKTDIKKYLSNDYVRGRSFIESLAFEATKSS